MPEDNPTIAGEHELAALNSYLDQNKADDADPKGKLSAVREACRELGRVIVKNTAPSVERQNALNDLQRVYTNAKIAVFR